MSDRDDFSELISSAKNAARCSSFYFNGRIRYGTKGERLEERLLCMDAVRVYICSLKNPVKIESHFNILNIKLIDRASDSHVIIETDEKHTHAIYSLHEKASLQPFLVLLIRRLHTVFPHRLQAIVEFRPENEYDRLLRLSTESYEDMNSDIRPCGGFSTRYECACDYFQLPCHRSVQHLVDTVFAHRVSREFTFREFEPLTQKDWLPIISALRHNDWFTKLTIENIKLSSENVDELCTVTRLCKALSDLRLINCGLSKDFGTRFSYCLSVTHAESVDLSYNVLEDKGLIALSSSLPQRKLPLRSLNLQSCSITHKSLQTFNAALVSNTYLLKSLRVLNLSGNRIKEESCITLLFSHNDNALEELHLSDIEFSLESFFHSLATMSCKLRRLFISSTKSSSPASIPGGVKAFFTKNQSLEILQLANANLSTEFLRELCDGLHANIHLDKLDLRLAGNQLESFVRDHAHRFATIPSLAALDLTACDLDNEAATLLIELKKNRKLKSLHLGKNFNNIKTKNMPRTITAMKELIFDSELEHLSLADSKLKENLAEFLLPVIHNTSLKVLDIRGNLMGDAGVRVLTHILQMNRHLHTIFFDRNALSLNNFEEIVNAMEENNVIQYLPVPVADITLMKTTEKERMEKLQSLMSKLDTICTRNQEQKETLAPADSLLVETSANLARETNQSWENQQQLIGQHTSLEYILSCSTRSNGKPEDIHSILARTARIGKISSELHDFYVSEEDGLKDEWNAMCKRFEEKLAERNERLSRKFYQLFKEQTMINYDDKLQEQIRTYFANSKENIDHLLHKEMPARVATYTRECYVNVATCLQKRAYETTSEVACDLQKQLDAAIFHSAAPSPQVSTGDGAQHSSSSTLDRLVNRGATAVHRLAHKQPYTQTEATDESPTSRAMKKSESNECLTDPSPKPSKTIPKDERLLAAQPGRGPTFPTPTSPKPPPPPVGWRRSVAVNPNESDAAPTSTDALYNNVPLASRLKKKEASTEDEGDMIEHDLLDLVEQEQQRDLHRNTPPPVPAKKRMAPTPSDTHLDLEIETTTKLIHPGKERPRRANIKRPVRRQTNGASQESSSDGGLDYDDNSIEDPPPVSTPVEPPASEPPVADLPPKILAKPFKSAPKPSKPAGDESSPPPVPTKTQPHLPTLQARTSNAPLAAATSVSRPTATTTASESAAAESTHEPLQGKLALPTGLYPVLNPTNKDEQKEVHTPPENAASPAPSVLTRSGKAPIGTRVLPALDPTGDAPPVKLRHFASERKASPSINRSSIENISGPEPMSAGAELSTPDDNEQYKRLSVKERARMLTTTIPPMTAIEKKPGSTPSNATVTSPYTPRNVRRIIEQVNLFC